MKINWDKTMCFSCIVKCNNYNPHNTNYKYIIKYVKNIDLDGSDIDNIFCFICVICKRVNNINRCYIFLK